jgi:hypothetical protein
VLGRFTQADTIVPEPGSPLALDRYAYTNNNPIKYIDSNGNVPIIPILVAAGIVIMKAIDYGWTAYDAWQSGKTLADPEASKSEKIVASFNIGLAAFLEAIEPDDLLPAGLPLDDAARRSLIKGAKEATEQGGDIAFERFVRNNLGEYADDIFKRIGFESAVDPKKLDHIFGNPEHNLEIMLDAFLSEEDAYLAVLEQFSITAQDFTNKQLKQGIQVSVSGFDITVRGVIVKGKAKIGTFFIP